LQIQPIFSLSKYGDFRPFYEKENPLFNLQAPFFATKWQNFVTKKKTPNLWSQLCSPAQGKDICMYPFFFILLDLLDV
jgi:hypothetical protein